MQSTAPNSFASANQLPEDLPELAVKLAGELLEASRQHEDRTSQAHAAQMARMIEDEAGKKFTISMTDQVLKIEDPKRAAQRLNSLIEQYGIPRYLSAGNRALLWMGNQAASLIPSFVMPKITGQVRSESSHVIISAEPGPFSRYVAKRKAEKIRINFNQLGEAVLGDREADHRLQAYLDRLASDEIVYVSVKLSSVVSQISLTGYQQTLEMLKERLRTIYRAAIQHGGSQPKFVNLDMEEYRDLHLTVDVFSQVLNEPEFENLEAGIVLQAYLPDSFQVQQDLTEWARERKQRTGAGIKIRLVKGANLAMEQVEASIRDWAQAPYHSKMEVDANYKRMLEYGSRPENAAIVRMGIASHNLFDIAFAMLVREHRQVQSQLEFEMLEGMANAQAIEVRDRTGGLIVYTPAVREKDFEAAVAYLVRRLDENTAPGSFLGDLFGLKVGSSEWNEQRAAFLKACELSKSDALYARPNRTQDRSHETPVALPIETAFHNAADTDFSLPANRQWAQAIVDHWNNQKLEDIPLEIAGQTITQDPTGNGGDPSRGNQILYRFCEANSDQVDQALAAAVQAQRSWEEAGPEHRATILRNVAAVFAAHRGDTCGIMMIDTGKAITEGDVEVSEAIDFANYYSSSLFQDGLHDGTSMKSRGVVVVTPPWNFPYAIPAGGCLAALMAGNAVILKPSPEAVYTAYLLAQQLWEAGIPRDVLQFLPINEQEVGTKLITDPRVAAVILTGSSDTARLFLGWRPELELFAETSGKNAMIITAFADLDLAVRDLVRGAFGHAGQKCSATSLALVESSVYDSDKFRNQLKDAASSLIVGPSRNPSAVVTPVVKEPESHLQRGLTTLEEGESWLLEPEMIDGNPCLWSPGIKLGVKPGSWYHKTECFGPVLGIIRVDNLRQAIEIQNSSHLGLTGGLHSLEPQEIALWRENVEVGNAYINRGTTGAIVQRQPFGGWKDSAVGPGAKAGGPNYVSCFGHWTEDSLPTLRSTYQPGQWLSVVSSLADSDAKPRLEAAAGSYQYWWEQLFSVEHDPSQLHGETNDFRYRPRPWHLVRIPAEITSELKQDLCLLFLAAQRTGTPLEISVSSTSAWLNQFASQTNVSVNEESLESLQNRLAERRGGTIRVLGTESHLHFDPAVIGHTFVNRDRPYANGRLELLCFLREQSISETVHRYGNIL